MPRPCRKVVPGGYYHALNRGNGRMTLFHKDEDFIAFLKVLAEGLERYPVDLLCYCLMSNHWHLVLRPATPDALSGLMRWVGVTHVRRHHEHYHRRGGGHLYQGRFKSFPIQDDLHFLTVCRYVEANPLRARLVEKAEAWPYGSLWAWTTAGRSSAKFQPPLTLSDWPVDRPKDWLARVNRPIEAGQMNRLHASVNRGRPLGDPEWVARTADRLGLDNTLRGPGRPRKNLPAQQRNNCENQ